MRGEQRIMGSGKKSNIRFSVWVTGRLKFVSEGLRRWKEHILPSIQNRICISKCACIQILCILNGFYVLGVQKKNQQVQHCDVFTPAAAFICDTRATLVFIQSVPLVTTETTRNPVLMLTIWSVANKSINISCSGFTEFHNNKELHINVQKWLTNNEVNETFHCSTRLNETFLISSKGTIPGVV